jgi:hypothetical protein
VAPTIKVGHKDQSPPEAIGPGVLVATSSATDLIRGRAIDGNVRSVANDPPIAEGTPTEEGGLDQEERPIARQISVVRAGETAASMRDAVRALPHRYEHRGQREHPNDAEGRDQAISRAEPLSKHWG